MLTLNRLFALLTICCLLISAPLLAQEANEKKPKGKGKSEKKVTAVKIPVIKDQPTTIDPATFMPAALQKQVTVDLTKASFAEMITWLQEEHKINALLVERDLDTLDILPSDPVNEKLENVPLYMLLNRLKVRGIAWYMQDNTIYFTTKEEINSHLKTLTYPMGSFLDQGIDQDTMIYLITGTIEPESWESTGGQGVISFLGDVMLITQTAETHRQIKGLLQGLKQHGRRTYIADPPQHTAIRQTLEKEIDFELTNIPLQRAMETLAADVKIDIRIDRRALDDVGVSLRTPVSINLAETKLKTSLKALLYNLDLSWYLQDGALWISTPEELENVGHKTAIYDVRDLCRDENESGALGEAIKSQASPDSWEELGGLGSLIFAKPGTLVINQTEEMHDEVLYLLEIYREALRNSKPRPVAEEEDPNKIKTVYYRMDSDVALDLEVALKQLIKPESWLSAHNEKAEGTILRLNSTAKIVAAQNPKKKQNATSENVLVNQSVLIITQTQANHEKITDILSRVLAGDSTIEFQKGGGFGGGGSGGGFGGGFFSVEEK